MGRPKEEVFKRIEKVKPSSGLNVYILLLESTSRMNAIRRIPKTMEYFQKFLGGIVLEGRKTTVFLQINACAPNDSLYFNSPVLLQQGYT